MEADVGDVPPRRSVHQRRFVNRRLVVIVVAVVVAVGGAAGIAIGVTATHSSGGSSPAPSARPASPAALSVNGSRAPVGVDPDAISFAWNVVDRRPNAVQRGYHIVVGSDPAVTAGSKSVVWDHDQPASAQQAFVAYDGPRLAADTQYWWTVATRDATGQLGPYAKPQPFVTGLRDNLWDAKWVRPGPKDHGPEEYTDVRKDITIGSSPIERATIYIGAAHQYALWVDGAYAGTGPSFAYPDAQYYQATDVTHLLHPGANAIGVLHHWYGPARDGLRRRRGSSCN